MVSDRPVPTPAGKVGSQACHGHHSLHCRVRPCAKRIALMDFGTLKNSGMLSSQEISPMRRVCPRKREGRELPQRQMVIL